MKDPTGINLLKNMKHHYHRNNVGRRYVHKAKQIIMKLLVYIVLLELGFIFLLPLLYLVSKSSMSMEDLVDASVVWLPSEFHWQNFIDGFNGLNFKVTGLNSLMMSVLPAVGQVISCAIAGYGLGRYEFPGSRIIFGVVLLCLIIPPQTTIISLYSLFADLHWINTYWPFIVPSFFAQGLRGALFMLIFTQFFKGLPKELDEAARIDGAGAIRVFSAVMLPLAKPAMFVVAMFSLVWNWNDTYMSQFFVNQPDMRPLPLQLMSVNQNYLLQMGNPAGGTQAYLMAACLLVVLPLFVIYIIGQRYLVEGVERTGLAGD
ncbi:carbohydrate ABC transporter permease [Paenibacillus nasutitermitis]|uniref:Transporter n=1 Tax=Paenibacillus nasutitermitis TaxID=1652958 RepID=A0A916YN96_9BACL|nr:carbohydrate ABC transporter permease [Paenibacillus nasutitermitis]GGD51219.1 transporter [Paenibacillus nasutitermitis]